MATNVSADIAPPLPRLEAQRPEDAPTVMVIVAAIIPCVRISAVIKDCVGASRRVQDTSVSSAIKPNVQKLG